MKDSNISIVDLIDKGTTGSYEEALQLCCDGKVDRHEISMAIATHIVNAEGKSVIAKNVRIRTIYDVCLKKDLTIDEAVDIVKEVQRRIDLRKPSQRYIASTRALQYGFARDVFLEAVSRASSYEHFLSLAKTISACSLENGCGEQRKILISVALAKLATIEEFREIYRLVGYV